MWTPTKTTIEISSPAVSWAKAKIVADYRWWTSELDPWRNLSVTTILLSGGIYQYFSSGSIKFFSDILDLYSGLYIRTEVIELRGMRTKAVGNPFDLGRTGVGDLKVRGSTIPFGRISWKVLSIV